MADAGEEDALRLAGLFSLVLRRIQLADQRARIGGDRDQPEQEACRQMRLRGPEGRGDPDRDEADDRDRRRAAQPRHTEAEPVAEDDPQIDRREGGGDLAAHMQLRAEESHVEAERDAAAQLVGRGPAQDMGEQSDRDQPVEAGEDLRQRRRVLGVQVDRDDQREGQPVEAHLVFRVGPAAQCGEARASRRAGHAVFRCTASASSIAVSSSAEMGAQTK